MTTKEAAEKLGVSIRRIQFLIQLGQLPAEKRGRDWWIEESDLEKLQLKEQYKRKEAVNEKDND